MKKVRSSSVISILFLFGILAMINAISVRHFVRYDLTSTNMYSLSETSKDILSSIEDKVIVKAYFTPDLPVPYNTTARYLRDMLEDYRAYSKGHLEYEFINPGSEEKFEREAQSFGIPPRQIKTVANDKIEVKLAYLGVVFLYGDKKETIPVLENISNLEYEITSLINRLASPRILRLGMASTGTEESKVTIQELYEALGRNYTVMPVSLDEPISVSFDGVFLIAPRQALTRWQLFNLDQYIMNGGKVAIFSNSYEVLREQGIANKRDLNLNGFLNNYGIGIGDDMLIDDSCGSVGIQARTGFFPVQQQVKFPYLPSLHDLNRENIITSELTQVQTYFPSSIDTTIAKYKGFEIEGLLYTSSLSGRERGATIRMQYLHQWAESDFPEKYIPVAAIVRGKFTSYFAESGPPKKPVAEDTGLFTASSNEENRLVVVGDGHMPLDGFIRSREVLFIQNVADWLVQAENLITIRSKIITLSPLKDIPNIAKKMVKWANQIVPIVLVIIFGIVLWQIRRLRKKALMIQISRSE